MSLALTFNLLTEGPKEGLSQEEMYDYLMDNTGEDISSSLSKDIDEYSVVHINDEYGEPEGYIFDFILQDAKDKLDPEKNKDYINILSELCQLGFYSEYEPYVGYLTKDEVLSLMDWLMKNEKSLKSEYYLELLEILLVAAKRDSGLLISAY